jgi:hypothetical protein
MVAFVRLIKILNKMSNISENKINTVIVAADMTIIKTSIDTVATKVPITTLTPDQRSTLLSMDVDNKVFAEDCITEIAISGTGIIPAFISGAAIQNDITLFEQCDVVEAQLENVIQKVRDVKRLAADEAMTVANAIYKIYEMAALAGVHGAQQAYDKLKARYAKQNTSSPEVTP